MDSHRSLTGCTINTSNPDQRCFNNRTNRFDLPVLAQVTENVQGINSEFNPGLAEQSQFSPFFTQKERFLVAVFFFFLKNEPACFILYSLHRLLTIMTDFWKWGGRSKINLLSWTARILQLYFSIKKAENLLKIFVLWNMKCNRTLDCLSSSQEFSSPDGTPTSGILIFPGRTTQPEQGAAVVCVLPGRKSNQTRRKILRVPPPGLEPPQHFSLLPFQLWHLHPPPPAPWGAAGCFLFLGKSWKTTRFTSGFCSLPLFPTSAFQMDQEWISLGLNL